MKTREELEEMQAEVLEEILANDLELLLAEHKDDEDPEKAINKAIGAKFWYDGVKTEDDFTIIVRGAGYIENEEEMVFLNEAFPMSLMKEGIDPIKSSSSAGYMLLGKGFTKHKEIEEALTKLKGE